MRAFHLEEPDRVPVTFSYVDPFVELDQRKRDLGYDRFHELVQKTDIVLPRSPRAGGVYLSASDEVRMERDSWEENGETYHHDTLVTPNGELHRRSKTREGVETVWRFDSFVQNREDAEKIMSMPFEPLDVDMSRVHDSQEMLGGRGIVAIGVADPICTVAELFTLRDFALTASRNQNLIIRLLDFFAERLEDYVKRMAEQSCDVMYRIVGPEYVTPPILPPALFDKYVVPYDKRLIDIVKRNDNVGCIHCHGQIGTVLSGIRKIDPHVLEPIEPPPDGDIELEEIKRRIGDRTCLMGYIQYKDLSFNGPGKIRQKVKEAIGQAAAGGGYIVFPTAEPIAEITDRLYANQREFVRAGKDFGKY